MTSILNDKLQLSRRQLLKSGAAALICGSAEATPALAAGETLRVGSFFIAIDYAPYLIAKSQALYDKLGGGPTQYTTFQSLPPVNEAFATGQIDAVFEAEPPALIGCAAGIDIKIVGISCSLVQDILVPKGSKAQTMADLKGSKIAVLAGTSSHYGVLKLLAAAGIAPDAVQIIDMAPPDAKSAFETGQVDAWAVWPPFVQQEEIAGTGRVLPKGSAQINSIMAVSGKLAKSNPQTVKGLVQILNQTKAWIMGHPEEAQGIVAKELGIPIAVVQRAWPSHNWAATLDSNVIADIQAKADFLFEGKYVGRRVDVGQVVDTSFN